MTQSRRRAFVQFGFSLAVLALLLLAGGWGAVGVAIAWFLLVAVLLLIGWAFAARERGRVRRDNHPLFLQTGVVEVPNALELVGPRLGLRPGLDSEAVRGRTMGGWLWVDERGAHWIPNYLFRRRGVLTIDLSRRDIEAVTVFRHRGGGARVALALAGGGLLRVRTRHGDELAAALRSIDVLVDVRDEVA